MAAVVAAVLAEADSVAAVAVAETVVAVAAVVAAGATRFLPTRLQKVFGCNSGDLFRRHAAEFCQLARGLRDESRLIALAAMWDRREIRRVSFDQYPVSGRPCERLPECRLTLGKVMIPPKLRWKPRSRHSAA